MLARIISDLVGTFQGKNVCTTFSQFRPYFPTLKSLNSIFGKYICLWTFYPSIKSCKLASVEYTTNFFHTDPKTSSPSLTFLEGHAESWFATSKRVTNQLASQLIVELQSKTCTHLKQSKTMALATSQLYSYAYFICRLKKLCR